MKKKKKVASNWKSFFFKTKDFEKYTDNKKWEKTNKKNIIVIYKALGYVGVNSNYLCNSLGAKDNNLKQ